MGYICILRNVGDKTLSNISVTDGTNEIGYRDTLAPGDVFRIKAKTPPLTRSSRFRITAISDGKEMASQEMSVLVRENNTKPLQNPSLIATVEAGRISALPSYKIKIANLGNDELSRVKILDSRNNALGIIPSLAPGESHTLLLNSKLDGRLKITAVNEVGSPIMGDVRYLGSPATITSGEYTLKTMEYRQSNGLELILETSKREARAGDNISYRCTVRNSADDVIYNVDLRCNGRRMYTEFLSPRRNLSLEGFFIFNKTTDLMANVSGRDKNGETLTNATSVRVWGLSSKLKMRASAEPPALEAGGATTITIELENAGPDLLRDISVEDSLGHIGEIRELKPGEVYSISRNLQANSSLDDEIFAKAVDSNGQEIYASAEIDILVYTPGMNLSVEPSQLLLYPDEEAEVVCIIENTGEVTLKNVTLAGLRSGRINELPPGTATRIAATIKSNSSEDIVITATGYGGYDQTVTDQAILSVRVVKPNITISVMPSRIETPPGEPYNMSCLVSNYGSDDLHDVKISEAELGTIAALGDLPAGEFRALSLPITVSENRTLIFTATAKDSRGRLWSASARSEAVIVYTALGLKVSVSPQAVRFGEKVTISCALENKGVVTLRNIFVTSKILGPIGSIEYLAPKERRTISIEIPLTMDISDTITAEGLTPSKVHVVERSPLNIRLLKRLEPRPSEKMNVHENINTSVSSVKAVGSSAANNATYNANISTNNITYVHSENATDASDKINVPGTINLTLENKALQALERAQRSPVESKEISAISLLKEMLRYLHEFISKKPISSSEAFQDSMPEGNGSIASMASRQDVLNTTLGIESVGDRRSFIRILDITAIPPEPVAGAPVRVVAHIKGDTDVDEVVLEYGVADQSTARADMLKMRKPSQIKMLLESGNRRDGYWSCLIPGQNAGTILGISVKAICGRSSAEDGPYMLQWVAQAPPSKPKPLPEKKIATNGMLYIESTTVSGRGEVSIRDTFTENALTYEEDLKGSGNLNMEYIRCMEKSNPVVNFSEVKDISFDGGVLKGFKRFDSPVFHGGMGASITERFNMSELEKSERGMIRSINYKNNTIAFSTEQAFEGMWNTRTEYSKFSKKMKADQRLNGSFQIQKNIKFQD